MTKPRLRILTKYDMEHDTYWLTALYGAKSMSMTFEAPPTPEDRHAFRRRAKRDLVPPPKTEV